MTERSGKNSNDKRARHDPGDIALSLYQEKVKKGFSWEEAFERLQGGFKDGVLTGRISAADALLWEEVLETLKEMREADFYALRREGKFPPWLPVKQMLGDLWEQFCERGRAICEEIEEAASLGKMPDATEREERLRVYIEDSRRECMERAEALRADSQAQAQKDTPRQVRVMADMLREIQKPTVHGKRGGEKGAESRAKKRGYSYDDYLPDYRAARTDGKSQTEAAQIVLRKVFNDGKLKKQTRAGGVTEYVKVTTMPFGKEAANYRRGIIKQLESRWRA